MDKIQIRDYIYLTAEMKLFRTLIPLEEAKNIVLTHARTLGIEELDFDAATGRVLAEDIVSDRDSPPFDRAAMDGYAVRAENTLNATPNNPVILRKSETAMVEEGEYLPVQTGMPVPNGSNAVLMLEYAKEDGSKLEVFKPVTPGKNVSFRGEDVKCGDVLLSEGRLLRAADIGLLASIGKSHVRVHRKAAIGIFSTGDELYDPKEHTSGKIADANSYILESLLRDIAKPVREGIIRDDYETLKTAIRSCTEHRDLILVSGGSSVGKRDFIADVVDDLGEMIFHGVAIRPGEPVGFGLIENTPIFCLPGYPVSLIAAFELLVRPFLYAMHGVKESPINEFFAVATKKIPSAVGRTDFVRVRLHSTDNGYFVEPLRVSGSGILTSVTKSDGFVIIEENSEGIEEGELIRVNLW